MKVAAVQHDIVWEDRDATLGNLETCVADGAAHADLIVLPEMFAIGFVPRPAPFAEEPDGPTVQWMRRQAARHDAWVCGSLPIRVAGEGRPRNELVVAGPDGTTHRYAKIHPFSYAGEHTHYAPGRDFLTVEIAGIRTTFFVCYDLRFADEFWVNAEATDMYVVVANWPASRRHHWRALLVARAIENQAYVVGVNRVGSGGGLDYAGDTAIVDPLGETLVAASAVETVLVAEVDAARVASVRAEFPFLADRR